MSGSFQDRTIKCREHTCGAEFVFSAGEQQFFQDRGFNPPTRCKSCRQRRKAEQQNGPQAVSASPPPQRMSQPAPNTAQEVEVQLRRPFGRRGGGKARRPRQYDMDDLD